MGRPKRMHNQGYECDVEGCTEEAVCLGMCHNCYQAEVRWAKRTPAARKHRREQLAKFQARMERLKGPHIKLVR